MTDLYAGITKRELSALFEDDFVKNSKVQGARIHWMGVDYACYILGYITTEELVDPAQILVLRIGRDSYPIVGKDVVIETDGGHKKMLGFVECLHSMDAIPTSIMEVRLK